VVFPPLKPPFIKPNAALPFENNRYAKISIPIPDKMVTTVGPIFMSIPLILLFASYSPSLHTFDS
jgi:hypothetical protein